MSLKMVFFFFLYVWDVKMTSLRYHKHCRGTLTKFLRTLRSIFANISTRNDFFSLDYYLHACIIESIHATQYGGKKSRKKIHLKNMGTCAYSACVWTFRELITSVYLYEVRRSIFTYRLVWACGALQFLKRLLSKSSLIIITESTGRGEDPKWFHSSHLMCDISESYFTTPVSK